MDNDLKPYPAYKASGVPWLGEIPAHWEYTQLRRLCKVFSGGTPDRSNPSYWTSGSIPWLSSGEVNKRRIHNAEQTITEEGLANSSAKWISPGSVLMAIAGQGKTKGMVATLEFPATGNQSLAAICPKPSRVNYGFLAYYLESKYKEIRGLVGDGLRDGLNLEILKSIIIPVPQLCEQEEINRFLVHIDRRINQFIRVKRRMIALLNEQKQAIIHRVVTRGLDSDARLKPSGVEWLGDVPEHWDVRRAKYYFREVDERTETGEEELLSVSHITGVTPRSQKNVTMFMAESYKGYKVCRLGDLVINIMWAWMGALGVSEHSGIVSYSYGVYRQTKPVFLSAYLDLLLRTSIYIAEFNSRSTGIQSSRLRVYTDDFFRVPVIQPPLDDQEAIVRHIRDATKEIEAVVARAQREIDLIREYRTRLIADVVTGKLDVRGVDLAAYGDEIAGLDEALADEGDAGDEELELASEAEE